MHMGISCSGPHCAEGPGNPSHPPKIYIVVSFEKGIYFEKITGPVSTHFPPNLGAFITISEWFY